MDSIIVHKPFYCCHDFFYVASSNPLLLVEKFVCSLFLMQAYKMYNLQYMVKFILCFTLNELNKFTHGESARLSKEWKPITMEIVNLLIANSLSQSSSSRLAKSLG